jgi:phospholipid/cholesterol/gamma-HCH transport system substrate-binding protein
MDDRVYRFRLGVVVAAAAAILVLLIMLMGDLPRPFTSRYDIYVNFPNAPGVSVGTPVRKAGITIGRVKEVQFLPDGDGVRLTLQLDGNRVVYDDEKCRISTASLLGDAIVEFYRPTPRNTPLQPELEQSSGGSLILNQVMQRQPAPRQPIPPGEILEGQVAPGPSDVVVGLEDDMRQALQAVTDAAGKINRLADNFNVVVGENQDSLPRILQKTEHSLDEFDQTMAAMRGMFGDEELQQKLKSSLQDMPLAIADARDTMRQMRQSFEGFEKIVGRADKNLENLEKFTAPLGERGPAIAANIESSIAKVDLLVEQLVEFSERLNARDGTLSRLLDDEELYDRLARVLLNAEDITRRIRPVIDNFTVASDKIARDPGILGVRGALDKRPVGQGNKGLFLNYDSPAVSYKLYEE